jgi:hypothetical protein
MGSLRNLIVEGTAERKRDQVDEYLSWMVCMQWWIDTYSYEAWEVIGEYRQGSSSALPLMRQYMTKHFKRSCIKDLPWKEALTFLDDELV